MDDRRDIDDLNDDEREALREIERGLESVYRAHGALVEFHHMIGRSMDHFDAAEGHLREDHAPIADDLRDDVLTAGVTADGKLTYGLVAEFEDGLLSAVDEVAFSTFDILGDGRRYPIERWDLERGGGSE